MSEMQIQAIKDAIKMLPRLKMEYLIMIKSQMEEAIDSELREIEPTVILENMDITEKIMYLDELNSKNKNSKEDTIPFEEILQKEGLTFEDLQDNN